MFFTVWIDVYVEITFRSPFGQSLFNLQTFSIPPSKQEIDPYITRIYWSVGYLIKLANLKIDWLGVK